MSNTLCEQALGRVLAYLELAGLAPTREVCLDALALVEEVLRENPPDFMSHLMRRLPERFRLPPVPLPPAFPPINRGSIGYGRGAERGD